MKTLSFLATGQTKILLTLRVRNSDMSEMHGQVFEPLKHGQVFAARWYTYPSEKYESQFNWDDDIPFPIHLEK